VIITVELSLYPLSTDYEPPIIDFIKTLQSSDEIRVHTHAMSTFVKGESQKVFLAINKAMEVVHEKSHTFSLVTKIINKDLPIDKGFLIFD